MGLKIDDLDPEVMKKLGLTKSRKQSFKAEDERKHAIKVLNVMSELTQSQRHRVLKRAEKLNNV